MEELKSAYNFVPAPTSDQVYTPDWASQVSHDVPFEDGQSGEIEIVITAQTPVFIREGISENEAKLKFENNKPFDFSHYFNEKGEKQYFIPATSLKGMIRNVFEILTFSRLNKSFVNNDRYSFRDLSRNSEYMKSYDANKVKAGWLKEDERGVWTIVECSFNHIHHSEVDRILGTNFRKLFLGKQPIDKTASFKYKLIKGKSLTSNFGLKESKTKPSGIAVYQAEGKKGEIVFTGQSGPRNESEGKTPSGKVHEFVFYNDSKGKFTLTEKQVEDFKFIYSDQDKINISPDWKYWRDILDNGGSVPVFFNKKDDKNIKHFGLSYMYKLPYENSVHEMFPLSDAEYNSKIDFATTLFGYTEKETSIKGRVFFGNATSKNAKQILPVKHVLGSPKASFTPFYLKQKDQKRTITYQEKGKLNGFKKYPVHSFVKDHNYTEDQLENNKVFSNLTPLAQGSIFNTKIRYHNLKKIEIGALISALTFHNNSQSFFHSIGGAKSYGYGALKIEVNNVSSFLDALQTFEYHMNIHCQKNFGLKWVKTPQIAELISVSAMPNSKDVESNLKHPSIGKLGGSDKNEFIEIKKEFKYLPNYSTINKGHIIESILTEDVYRKWEQQRIEVENKKKIEKLEKQNKIGLLIEEANNELNSFNFDLALYKYKEALQIFDDNSLNSFLTKIENKKIEKLEIDAYNRAISENTIIALENFILNYPLSENKEKASQCLSKLKAQVGVPARLLNLKDSDTFFKECDVWKSKLPNKLIVGTEFETSITIKITELGLSDMLVKKTSVKWLNGINEKKVINLLNVEITNGIFKKILDNHG